MGQSYLGEVGAVASSATLSRLDAARAALAAALAAAHAVLRIENIRHIETAYGIDAAGEVRLGLSAALGDVIGHGGTLIEIDPGLFQLLVFDREEVGGQAGGRRMAWLDRLCKEVSATVFPSTAGPLHIWLSGQWIDQTDDEDASVAAIAHGFLGEQVGGVGGWAARYRADMTLVGSCLGAIEASRSAIPSRAGPTELHLAWQPICAAQDPATILYREALLRVMTAADVHGSPHDTIQAFERLGFATLLDRYVVDRVIEELERSPDIVLGVNISAQSARWNGDWEEICAHFAAHPGVASRLILEVTESTPIADIGETALFVSRMRRTGCRIAVDDFGVGHASIRQLLALAPDIVKIDHVFLRRAVVSNAGLETLTHMVALAGSIASTVIVEGIEDEADLELAHAAGAEWQQGYHFARPTCGMPWRNSAKHRSVGIPGFAATAARVAHLHSAAQLPRGRAL